MKAVFQRECRHQLLSFKSIFFILLFIVLGVSLEQLFSAVSIDIGGIDNKTYAGSFYVIIKLAVILFGYLFSSILSHSCINREMENKSARLVISKISRTEYIVGKYLANIMFWIICFVLIYGGLFLRYRVFDISALSLPSLNVKASRCVCRTLSIPGVPKATICGAGRHTALIPSPSLWTGSRQRSWWKMRKWILPS